MRKIYSFAVMVVMAMVMFTANAETKTVTIKDEVGCIDFVQYGPKTKAFENSPSVEYTFTENGWALEFNAKDGYVITDLQDDNDQSLSQVTGKGTRHVEIGSVFVSDGDVIKVVGQKGGGSSDEEITFTLKLADTNHISMVKYGTENSYTNLQLNWGDFSSTEKLETEYTITGTTNFDLIIQGFFESDPSLKITEIVNQNSENLLEEPVSYASVPFSKISDRDVLTVIVAVPEGNNYTFTVDDLSHLNRIYNAGMGIFLYASSDFDASTSSCIVPAKNNDGNNVEFVYIVTESDYVVTAITVNGNPATNVTLPGYEVYFPLTEVPKNAKINITTGKKPTTVWTFNNANGVQFSYNSKSTVWESDEPYEFEVPADCSSLNLQYKDASKKIVSVKDASNEGPEIYNYDGVWTVGTYEYGMSTTFDITTVEVSTSSFTVKTDDASLVTMRLNISPYGTVTLKDGEEGVLVNYEENVGTNYSIGGVSGKFICSVTVENGGETTSLVRDQYGTFIYTPTANDVVTIKAKFDNKDVAVKFDFAEGVTKNIISKVSVDYQDVTNWDDENFTVKLGSQISLGLNTNGYEDIVVKVNGQEMTGTTYFVDTEDDVIFDISGTALPPVKTTVSCENWEAIEIYLSTDKTRPVEVTGETTEFEADPNSKFEVWAKPGYYFTTFTDKLDTRCDGNAAYYQFTASAENTITLTVVPDGKDKTLVVYVDESVLPNFSMYVANSEKYWLNNNYSQDNGNLVAGYNMVRIDKNDVLTFNVSNSPENFDMYWNNELLPKTVTGSGYLSYEAKSNIDANSVLKVFGEVPEIHEVSVTIPEEMPLDAYYDYVSAADANVNNVFHGTHLVLKPRVEAQQAKMYRAANDKKIVVKVDGTEVTPKEDGSFVIPVENDMAVEASYAANTETGIEEIVATEGNHDIFNLQGVRVGNTSDVRELPAGVYIINGKKVRR